MCTWAPDAAMPRAYFADYEAYEDGHAVAWGQAVLTCAAQDDADEVIARLRQQAADRQGVPRAAIRLRSVCRL